MHTYICHVPFGFAVHMNLLYKWAVDLICRPWVHGSLGLYCSHHVSYITACLLERKRAEKRIQYSKKRTQKKKTNVRINIATPLSSRLIAFFFCFLSCEPIPRHN